MPQDDMRETFGGVFDGLSDPDPTRRAQKQMKRPLPKRFYTSVDVARAEDGHAVLLDGKPLRTPARQPLVLPTAGLAAAVASEWQAQREEIDPTAMPLTRLVNTALDGVARETEAVAADIVRFAGTDLLCYRADAPESLVDRQNAHWDPLLNWAREAMGARFVLSEGVMHVEQPPEALAAFAAHLGRFDHPLQLASLHTITALTGSAIIALAVASGAVGVDEAWAAAHVDEDFNIEQWGEDAEAQLRRARRFDEMRAAAAVLSAL